MTVPRKVRDDRHAFAVESEVGVLYIFEYFARCAANAGDACQSACLHWCDLTSSLLSLYSE